MLEWVDVCTAGGRRAPRARTSSASPTAARPCARARSSRAPSFALSRRRPGGGQGDPRRDARQAPRGAAVGDQDLRLDLQEPRPTRRAPRAAPPASCSRRPAARASTVGGARLSPKHANFVENAGAATHRRRARGDGRGPPARPRALRGRARARGPGARRGRLARRLGARDRRLTAGGGARRELVPMSRSRAATAAGKRRTSTAHGPLVDRRPPKPRRNGRAAAEPSAEGAGAEARPAKRRAEAAPAPAPRRGARAHATSRAEARSTGAAAAPRPRPLAQRPAPAPAGLVALPPRRRRRSSARPSPPGTSSGFATRRWSRSTTSTSSASPAATAPQIVSELTAAAREHDDAARPTRPRSSRSAARVPDGRSRSTSTRTSRTACGSRSPSARRRCWSSAGGRRGPRGRRRDAARPGVDVAERRAPAGARGRAELPPTADARAASRSSRRWCVGAAPEPLRPLIEKVDDDEGLRVELTLRGGIPVRFGTGSRARREKWAAAAAVLADPKLDALTYLDVRVPERAAAGGAAERPRSAELSTIGRDFRIYVNPRLRDRGLSRCTIPCRSGPG